MITRICPALAMFVLVATTIHAQTPLGTAFTYQGRLESASSPVTGVHDLRFRLYDAFAAGLQVGATVCFNNVNVTDGLFTVPLDFGAQFTGDERFLEIDVRADSGRDCTNAAGFVVLSPRQALTTAPHAAYALNADQLDGLDSTAFLQSIPVPLALIGTTNNWIVKGENTTTIGGAASINGTTTGATGSTYGGYFLNFSTSGTGVLGLTNAASGTTYGVRGQSSSTSGYGVHGAAIATTGTSYGVYGSSSSSSGFGVRGTNVDNVGVRGDATGTSGLNYGVYGTSTSTDGIGVFGIGSAADGTNYGGYFQSNSDTGRGVYGYAIASTGSTYGVYGQANSSFGVGVYGSGEVGVRGQGATDGGVGVSGGAAGSLSIGVSGSADWFGVFGTTADGSGVGGTSTGPSGRGVYGQAYFGTGVCYGGTFEADSTSGRGVYGNASASSGTIYGVLGSASTATSGYGVYASGDLGASGTKSFRIDHPSDPENKYLLHYSVESPEVLNAYSGKVTLDGRGEAMVELPHYFAKINKDPRYTLTAVGAPMPMLHVAEEIDETALIAGANAEPGEAAPLCSFRIAGGAPGAKVSWEIKVLRNDLRMRVHGAPVEREKEGLERGTYQHPEFYGQPPEKGMDYDAERVRPSPPMDSGSTPHEGMRK